MNVHLDQRAIPDGFEAVNLAGFNHENVPRAAFKRLSVHGPYSAAFPDKLDLIVGMPMRPGPLARQPAEQKHADAHVSLLGTDKFVGASHKRQLFLTDAVHSSPPCSSLVRCPREKRSYKSRRREETLNVGTSERRNRADNFAPSPSTRRG